MSLILLAVIISAVIFAVIIVVASKITGGKKQHSLHVLRNIENESRSLNAEYNLENAEILKEVIYGSSVLSALLKMPGGEALAQLILKAGEEKNAQYWVLASLPVSLVGFLFMKPLAFVVSIFTPDVSAIVGVITVILVVGFGLFGPAQILKYKIKKRKEKFVNMFPEVLDMIVRGLRSGFPLQASLKMVAENMDSPVREEFELVLEDVAAGRGLYESLVRLSTRIDEPDVQFFIVILNVQQETGGNLAAVMSNLADVIRKRKYLRLKIKALTAEGRATAVVLGLLPIVFYFVLDYIVPGNFDPFFKDPTGKMILSSIVGLLVLNHFVVRAMINIKI